MMEGSRERETFAERQQQPVQEDLPAKRPRLQPVTSSSSLSPSSTSSSLSSLSPSSSKIIPASDQLEESLGLPKRAESGLEREHSDLGLFSGASSDSASTKEIEHHPAMSTLSQQQQYMYLPPQHEVSSQTASIPQPSPASISAFSSSPSSSSASSGSSSHSNFSSRNFDPSIHSVSPQYFQNAPNWPWMSQASAFGSVPAPTRSAAEEHIQPSPPSSAHPYSASASPEMQASHPPHHPSQYPPAPATAAASASPSIAVSQQQQQQQQQHSQQQPSSYFQYPSNFYPHPYASAPSASPSAANVPPPGPSSAPPAMQQQQSSMMPPHPFLQQFYGHPYQAAFMQQQQAGGPPPGGAVPYFYGQYPSSAHGAQGGGSPSQAVVAAAAAAAAAASSPYLLIPDGSAPDVSPSRSKAAAAASNAAAAAAAAGASAQFRANFACTACRRGHRACTGGIPCIRCVRLGRADSCVPIVPKSNSFNSRILPSQSQQQAIAISPQGQQTQPPQMVAAYPVMGMMANLDYGMVPAALAAAAAAAGATPSPSTPGSIISSSLASSVASSFASSPANQPNGGMPDIQQQIKPEMIVPIQDSAVIAIAAPPAVITSVLPTIGAAEPVVAVPIPPMASAASASVASDRNAAMILLSHGMAAPEHHPTVLQRHVEPPSSSSLPTSLEDEYQAAQNSNRDRSLPRRILLSDILSESPAKSGGEPEDPAAHH